MIRSHSLTSYSDAEIFFINAEIQCIREANHYSVAVNNCNNAAKDCKDAVNDYSDEEIYCTDAVKSCNNAVIDCIFQK